MYYYPGYNSYNRSPRAIGSRFAAGGFIVPFALGFLTAPWLLPSRPNYYQPRPPYYTTTPNYYY